MNIDSYIDLILEGKDPSVLLQELVDVTYGARGLKFEDTLMQAFKMSDLDFDENRTSGAVWDVQTKGKGWTRLTGNKQINIKVSGSTWLFGSTEFTNILPWEEVPNDFNFELAKKKIRKALIKRGLPQVVFLKPKSRDIENSIAQAVQEQDKEKVDSLLVKRNFDIKKLGRHFRINISIRDNRIGSVSVTDSSGRVFMRSERPRYKNKTGNPTVAFKTPKTLKGKITQIKVA